MAISTLEQRFAHKMARFGIQVPESLPLFKADTLAELREATDHTVVQQARQLSDEQKKMFDRFRRQALTTALATDFAVGAGVAALATLWQDHQLKFVIGSIVALQSALLIAYYYLAKLGLETMANPENLPPDVRASLPPLNESVREQIAANIERILKRFRATLRKILLIRSFEFFLFASLFSLAFSYISSDLGSLEGFLQYMFSEIAGFFASDQRSNEMKVVAGLFQFGFTVTLSLWLQRMFPTQVPNFNGYAPHPSAGHGAV